MVPEEQDVDTDHDAYKRKDVDHNSYVSSHAPAYRVTASGEKAIDALRGPVGRDPTYGRDPLLRGIPECRSGFTDPALGSRQPHGWSGVIEGCIDES